MRAEVWQMMSAWLSANSATAIGDTGGDRGICLVVHKADPTP